MSALDRLSLLLRGSLGAAERPFPPTDALNSVIAGLQKHNKTGTASSVPDDLQQAAVRKFWDSMRFETLRDARLVSFGMCVPSRPSGPCIMEDRQRFLAVLDNNSGIDQWANEPRWYRRCYQGLLRSYFTYDSKAAQAPAVGKQNWGDLRDYLSERTHNIGDKHVNPEWVDCVLGNRQLFGENPCAPYAADVLSGDKSKIEHLCEQLGVIKSSWFLRELVLAQVREATKLSHERFKNLIPRLLELLSSNLVLRDRGLILLLDKYASVAHPCIHEALRNASVDWWGNPWLPSNETRWGGVLPAAREMVSVWLMSEFIEAFFTKLAEDGVGDRRRANFWLRYVKSMDNIQFALGATALHSRDPDFVVLRKKMKGLYTELKSSASSNNAFVMTLGDLVAVEFGGDGNAFYGYDIRKTLPFDASRPVGTTVNALNSLKHRSRMLWMQHQDGIRGWGKWEDMFEATLKEHFDIRPNATSIRRVVKSEKAVTPIQTPPSPISPQTLPPEQLKESDESEKAHYRPRALETEFTMDELRIYTRLHGLTVDDHSGRNGNIWVRTDNRNDMVNMVLEHWGFRYKAEKGWWR